MKPARLAIMLMQMACSGWLHQTQASSVTEDECELGSWCQELGMGAGVTL